MDSPASRQTLTQSAALVPCEVEKRSLILLTPGVIARVDRNVLINPRHLEFPRLAHALHLPVWWMSDCLGELPVVCSYNPGIK